MLQIRSRVIELSSKPDFLDHPVEVFEEPGRAKEEADAYLAMTTNVLTEELAESATHRDRFLALFSKKITDDNPMKLNTSVDPGLAFDIFDTCFAITYHDDEAIDRALETQLGVRTSEACNLYADACDAYLMKRFGHTQRDPTLRGSHDTYREPDGILQNGMVTFDAVAGQVERDASALIGIAPEQRLARLTHPHTVRGMLKIASLALNQALQTNDENMLTKHTREYADIAHSIGQIRVLPKHADSVMAVLRPHGMCPALPELPETEIIPGDSGIVKLWKRRAELVHATHLTALDDNRPEYAIVGYERYHTYREQGNFDV